MFRQQEMTPTFGPKYDGNLSKVAKCRLFRMMARVNLKSSCRDHKAGKLLFRSVTTDRVLTLRQYSGSLFQFFTTKAQATKIGLSLSRQIETSQPLTEC